MQIAEVMISSAY